MEIQLLESHTFGIILIGDVKGTKRGNSTNTHLSLVFSHYFSWIDFRFNYKIHFMEFLVCSLKPQQIAWVLLKPFRPIKL